MYRLRSPEQDNSDEMSFCLPKPRIERFREFKIPVKLPRARNFSHWKDKAMCSQTDPKKHQAPLLISTMNGSILASHPVPSTIRLAKLQTEQQNSNTSKIDEVSSLELCRRFKYH
jgi:hypothetical protein